MRACAVALAASLAGCAAVAPREVAAPAAWSAHRQAVGQLHQWQVSGRFSVQHDGQRWQGALRWQQDGGAYDLVLTSPMEQGGVALHVDAYGSELRASDGTRFSGEDAEELLAGRTGWRLPVSALGFWLRGLPAQGEGWSGTWDEDGALASLRQRGFAIDYKRYTLSQHWRLPARMDLRGSGLDARLVLDDWRLPEANDNTVIQ